MADFSSLQPDLMIAAAQVGADALAEALNRAFASEFKITAASEAEPFADANSLPLSGRTLVLQGLMEGGCLVAVLPATAGLAPAWCAAPDEAEKERLDALARELFQAVLPEEFAPSELRVQVVDEIGSLDQVDLHDEARFFRFTVASELGEGEALLLWPAKSLADLPLAASDSDEPLPGRQDATDPNAASSNAADPKQQLNYSNVADGLRQLPTYARNLLKISVDVSAILAAKKMSVQDVHQLSPGSIIEFDKSCEEPLTLEVGDQLLAEGEAVRVGERFGIWITQIALPEERFSTANRRRA